MSRYTERLWNDLAREHGPALALADRPDQSRARRPRLIAGSTLAVAGGGVALALGLTATGSTPAFAVTTSADGSVQVTISQTSELPQANAKLTAMGVHEQIVIDMASGAAASGGAVTCTPAAGVSGPPVTVLVGTDGTEVIAPGATKKNTGEGSWHLAACMTVSDGYTGNTGIG